MNKTEQIILRDMEIEGKVMQALLILLVIGFIFACGYMTA